PWGFMTRPRRGRGGGYSFEVPPLPPGVPPPEEGLPLPPPPPGPPVGPPMGPRLGRGGRGPLPCILLELSCRGGPPWRGRRGGGCGVVGAPVEALVLPLAGEAPLEAGLAGAVLAPGSAHGQEEAVGLQHHRHQLVERVGAVHLVLQEGAQRLLVGEFTDEILV